MRTAPSSFTIGSWPRAGMGLGLLSTSLWLLWFGRDMDWGVGFTTWVPALALLVPGLALLRRRVLRSTDGRLLIEQGWLWRRAWSVPLGGALESLPTAGLRAVVLHQGGSHIPLATWVTNGTAGRLLTWLDAHHPEGAFPRLTTPPPAGDR